MVVRTIIAQYVKEMRKKYKLTQVDLSEQDHAPPRQGQ